MDKEKQLKLIFDELDKKVSDKVVYPLADLLVSNTLKMEKLKYPPEETIQINNMILMKLIRSHIELVEGLKEIDKEDCNDEALTDININ